MLFLHKDKDKQCFLFAFLFLGFLILPAIENKLRVTSHMYAHCNILTHVHVSQTANIHTAISTHNTHTYNDSTIHYNTFIQHDDICNVSILLSRKYIKNDLIIIGRGTTYGRKMMTGFLAVKDLESLRIMWVLHFSVFIHIIIPAGETLCIVKSVHIPYTATYFGEKLHITK